MKYKVFNILVIAFMIMSGIFGAFAPVSDAISYYMLLGGWIAAFGKLSYQYVKAVKEKEYLSGEIFTILSGTVLFFSGHEIEAVAFMSIVTVTMEVLKILYSAVNKKREKIESYIPQSAVIFKDGEETEINAKDLETGNIVIVNTGEKIPADGIVFRGTSVVDGKYFNIAIPYEASKGDKVLGGYINTGEQLQVEVTNSWENSFFNRCIRTASEAADGISKLEVKFKLYEKILTSLIMVVSLLAIVVMVFAGGAEISSAIVFAVVTMSSVVLYNTCKVSGKSTASFIYDKLKEGIVISSREACDKITKIEGLVLEDDGRIAEGNYELLSIMETEGVTKEEILTYAAHLKYFSKSNLSKAVVSGYQQLAKYEGLNAETSIRFTAVSNVEEIAGKGITGKVAGKFVCAGNEKLMALLNISELPEVQDNTLVHVAVNQKYIGSLVLKYIPKEGMEEVLEHWNKNGINNYAVDKGNFQEIVDELKDVSTEEGTVAYLTTKCNEEKQEKVDVVAIIDATNSKEFEKCDVLIGSKDLKDVSAIKKSIAEKNRKIKVQGIGIMAFKSISYGVAALLGISVLVPAVADAIVTICYTKANI